MICPFKNCGDKTNNPNFDEPVEHLILTFSRNNHVHIHGPFDNEYIIHRFYQSLVAKMEKHGIKPRSSTEDRPTD